MKQYVLLLILGICLFSNCTPTLQTMRSWEQIEVLKSGYLIIFLDSEQEKIDKLYTFGYDKRADKLTEKQEKQQGKIIEIFNKNFTFCPVYFTRDTLGTDYVFLNRNAQPDESIRPKEGSPFFGKFENRFVDEYGDEEREIYVFQIFDKDNQRLRSPFPAYVELQGYPAINVNMAFPINSLDKRLHTYFAKPRGKR